MKRKLPIRSTIRATYQQIIDDSGYVVRIAGSWTIISLILPFWMVFATGGNDLLLGVSTCVFTAGWLAIAMRWHRRCLRRDAPGFTIMQHVFLSGAYGLQLLSILHLAALAFTPAIVIVFFNNALVIHIFGDVSDMMIDENLMIGATIAVAILAVALVFGRLSLALPATALGVVDFGVRASWKHTSGNGLRFLIAWISTAIPPVVPILAYLYFNMADQIARYESHVVSLAILTIALCLASIFLLNTLSLVSIAYAYLVEKKAVPTPARTAATGVVVRT